MSAQITTVAAELGQDPADVIAIVNQLSDLDRDDTNHAVGRGDVIETADGTYENAWLTPGAIESLYDQFGGDAEQLHELHGIRR